MKTTATAPSYEVIREHYKVMTRRLMKQQVRRPDDDLLPTLFIETEHGTKLAGFHPAIFDDQDAKTRLFTNVIPTLLFDERADTCGLAVPIWWISPDSGVSADELHSHYEAGGQASDHPAREEAVMLVIASAGEVECSIAPVVRRPNQRPKLGSWQFNNKDGGGLLVDSIALATAAVRGVAEVIREVLDEDDGSED